MSSSVTITLFSERPQFTQRPTSFLFSVLAHGAAIGAVSLGFMLQPRIIPLVVSEHMAVRHIDLHMPDPRTTPTGKDGELYPGPQPVAHITPPGKSSMAPPAVARQVAQQTPTQQTLLQPKLPPRVLPDKVPLPTVVLWSAETNPMKIVPPLPQKTASALVKPAIDPPNDEQNLADVALKSSDLSTQPQPILPSNSSPLVVLAHDPAQAPPQTTSKSTDQPTPAAVVSLSDLRKEGTVALPPANQSASANSSGLLAAGRPEDLAKPDANGNAQGAGAGHQGTASANAPGDNNGSNGAGKADPGPSTSAATGAGAGIMGSVTRYMLPHDGQFGVVVVGSSLAEMYPEMAELWSGRLSYTVYLHVGLKHSWILQYALPADTDAGTAGNATHLLAPWPYTIVRPDIAPGEINADALMIHGFIDKAGRFVSMAVAFPSQFPRAEFVLSSLKQWEFRPASQAGQATRVEVLLIIPEEPE
jgi:hypothetical protein